MTRKEKQKLIQDSINVLNETFLKPMKAQVAFEVDGTNKYSLIIKSNGKRLKSYGQTFYTYDDVLSALRFYTDIFDRYMHEKFKK